MDLEDLAAQLKTDLPRGPWRRIKIGDYWQLQTTDGKPILIAVGPDSAAAERVAVFLEQLRDMDLTGWERQTPYVEQLQVRLEELEPLVQELKASFGNVTPTLFKQIENLLYPGVKE